MAVDMHIQSMHERILRYGTIVKDIEYDDGDYHRIRIITFNDHLYYDHMCEGEIIECEDITSKYQHKEW